MVDDGRGQEQLEEEDEIAELEQRMKSGNLPEHALKAAKKELKVHPSSYYSSLYSSLRHNCLVT